MKYQSKFGYVPVTANQVTAEGNQLHVIEGVACIVLDPGQANQMVVPVSNWLVIQGSIRYSLSDSAFKHFYVKMEFEDALQEEKPATL